MISLTTTFDKEGKRNAHKEKYSVVSIRTCLGWDLLLGKEHVTSALWNNKVISWLTASELLLQEMLG